MKNLFLTFGLLILGCQVEIVRNNKCQTMILSDAQPVQFWLTNCDTYNEKEVCGVHQKCFCQPFECADEIKVQAASDVDGIYTLLILDEAGATIHEIEMEDSEDGYYNASFIPAELSPDICDERIQLKIVFSEETIESTLQETTYPALATWDSLPFGVGTWTINGFGEPQITLGAFQVSNGWGDVITNPVLGTYNFVFSALASIGGNSAQMAIHLLDSGDNIIESSSPVNISGSGSGTINAPISVTANPAAPFKLMIQVNNTSGSSNTIAVSKVSLINRYRLISALVSGGDNEYRVRFNTNSQTAGVLYVKSDAGVTLFSHDFGASPGALSVDFTFDTLVDIPYFEIYNDADYDETLVVSSAMISIIRDTVQAKSDCLDIKTTHDCSYLVEYTNHRNLASLNFNQDSSPQTTFYLRIPAVFFHESFPQEQEVLELSNSQFVELNSKLEAKRMFETDYMPYYMHRKLQLVLMAQSLIIDEQAWIKRDAYEIGEGNKRWPVKMGRVLLTEADNVQRNVL